MKEEQTEPMTYTDMFLVDCPFFDKTDVKAIGLPKFIVTPPGAVGEKSKLLFTFHARLDLYKRLAEALRERRPWEIELTFTESTPKSIWTFHDCQSYAVDFGSIAELREDPREVAMEFSYNSLTIDGIELL